MLLLASVAALAAPVAHAATVTLASVEAETLAAPAGASVISDSAASASKALKLSTNATAKGQISVPSSSNRITFRARGAQCSGAPQMVATVDGKHVLTTAVSSSSWADHSTALKLAAGTRSLQVSFTNDYTRANQCSRDLFVDRVTIQATNVDASRPTPAVLSATPGDQQVPLSWTAATDNVGVTRYEVWKDSRYVTTLAATARSYLAANLVNATAYSFRVVAYDAAGNYANSNTVTVTPAPSPPAAFPSSLKARGRAIVDENNHVLPRLKGFNMHVGPGFTWEQSHFDDIAALGGRVNRAVVHWDQFEPSQGLVDAAAIASLDLHIARARAAGIYTMIELHLNVGRSPAWTSSHPTELEKYAHHGQVLTQYLADRYGDPVSPHYTKAVIGFGLNEPPLEDAAIRNGNGSIPYLEAKQHQMIAWMRAFGHAPAWIGFVAVGYAGATPIYDDGRQNPAATDASPAAYEPVGGNVVYDVHNYMMGCEVPSADPTDHTLSADAGCDGRQWNGMNHPTYQGGPQISTDSTEHAYVSTAASRGQLAAFMKPYKDFTTQASIPLMLGEWGWAAGMTGELAWITDQKAVWTDAATAIEIHWNYDVAASKWAARPGGSWRPSVTTWLSP